MATKKLGNKHDKNILVSNKKLAMLLLFCALFFYGCKSARAPKHSARLDELADSIKRATIDSIFQTSKHTPRYRSSNLDEISGQIFERGGLNVYLNLIQPVERQKLEAEKAKLAKKAATWEKIAAVLFLIATGHILKTVTD